MVRGMWLAAGLSLVVLARGCDQDDSSACWLDIMQ